MSGPPEAQMRNRPAANGTAYRSGPIEPQETTEPLQQIQARELRRLHALSFAASVTIGRLAYAVAP